jgi:hypothetical protein
LEFGKPFQLISLHFLSLAKTQRNQKKKEDKIGVDGYKYKKRIYKRDDYKGN